MRSTCRLDELVASVDEKTGLVKDPALPYLGLEHIGQRGAGLTRRSESAASISANSIFKAGDVLFGKLRPNLRKCTLAPFDGYCSTDVLVLRPHTDVDPRFAARMFQTERVGAEAEKTAAGTKMPRTSWKELRALEVFRPDIQSQQCIADVLDTLDTTIRQTEAIIEKLKQVKQGLLHDLLTRGIDANGELRQPPRRAPHLYKDSPVGWLPKEWRCETVGRVIQGTPRNGLYKPAGDIGFGALLVGQTAFTHEGSVDFGQARRARVSNAERETFGLNLDDLLVSRVFATREGVGQPVIVPEPVEPAVYESNMMRLRANLQMIEPRLLFLWLKHQTARAWIMSRAFASNQASINRQTICSVPTPTPPIAEQRAILEVCRAHEHRLSDEIAGLEKLRPLKSGLMDDLLTGRVRVTPLLTAASP